jgi:hypothetical protein
MSHQSAPAAVNLLFLACDQSKLSGLTFKTYARVSSPERRTTDESYTSSGVPARGGESPAGGQSVRAMALRHAGNRHEVVTLSRRMDDKGNTSHDRAG